MHLTGIILTASYSLQDTIFHKAVVFIVEHNEKGALGFVVNKIFERSLNQLVEFRHSPAFPLHAGGPVDTEHLYFIHRRPELISEGTPVVNGICYGGNFAQAIRGINNGTLTTSDIKIFIGYCGWDAGELEAEIAEGSWTVTSAASDFVFS